jgi:hypothetical protein
LRVCYAISGYPAEAARTGEKQLFSHNIFIKALEITKNIEKCFYAYLSFKYLNELRNKPDNISTQKIY